MKLTCFRCNENVMKCNEMPFRNYYIKMKFIIGLGGRIIKSDLLSNLILYSWNFDHNEKVMKWNPFCMSICLWKNNNYHSFIIFFIFITSNILYMYITKHSSGEKHIFIFILSTSWFNEIGLLHYNDTNIGINHDDAAK